MKISVNFDLQMLRKRETSVEPLAFSTAGHCYTVRVSYKTGVAEHAKIRILLKKTPKSKPWSGSVFPAQSVGSLTQSHAYVSASQARVSPSTSYTPSRHKRSYEEDEDMDLHPSKQKEQHMGKSCCWEIVILISFQDLSEIHC